MYHSSLVSETPDWYPSPEGETVSGVNTSVVFDFSFFEVQYITFLPVVNLLPVERGVTEMV